MRKSIAQSLIIRLMKDQAITKRLWKRTLRLGKASPVESLYITKEQLLCDWLWESSIQMVGPKENQKAQSKSSTKTQAEMMNPNCKRFLIELRDCETEVSVHKCASFRHFITAKSILRKLKNPNSTVLWSKFVSNRPYNFAALTWHEPQSLRPKFWKPYKTKFQAVEEGWSCCGGFGRGVLVAPQCEWCPVCDALPMAVGHVHCLVILVIQIGRTRIS